MKKAKKTAICGMMSALSVVLMFFTTFTPILMYVLPILTGLIVWLVSQLIDKKWALGVYFSTSIISLVLLTDKEAALTYSLFFGFYPLIKDAFERLPKVFSWVLKIILFNASAVLIGVAGVFVFGLSGEEYSEFGKATVPMLLSLANIVFLMYDNMLKKYKFFMIELANRINKIFKSS